MKLPSIKSIYDTEQVRQLLEAAEGEPKAVIDVHNLLRPGKLLEHTYIRRGSYDRRGVNEIMTAILRRRLARDLGRISPRLLDVDHDIECPECGAVAVRWDGKWKCEDGHQGYESMATEETKNPSPFSRG